MISDKNAKTILQGNNSLQKMMLGQLDRHIKKNEVGPLPYTTRKKNELKMDHRPKCKLLKVNTGVNLHDPGLG